MNGTKLVAKRTTDRPSKSQTSTTSAPLPTARRERPHATAGSPRIRAGYAVADDGVRLYWRAIGTGPPLVCCNGVGVSTFFWKYIVEQFSAHRTVIIWDYRGHGRSDRQLPRLDMRIERHADDLACVLEAAAGGEPAVLIGHSMGCQVSLEARRRRPVQVRGMVLMLGTAGRALHTFYDWPHSHYLFRAAHRLIFALGRSPAALVGPLLLSPAAWPLTRRLQLVDPYYAPKEDMMRYLGHMATLDLRVFIESTIQTDRHDAWDTLPTLGCPMLVIAAENDKFTPLWCSRKMVDMTPGAELLVLADASHAALVEQPETIQRRIQRFLTDRQL